MKIRQRSAIISGQIGIVDAALIRYFEEIKKQTGHLFNYVTESIYPALIPEIHIKEFLQALSCVDCVLKDQSELKETLLLENSNPITLPEEILKQYSLQRIFKKNGYFRD